MAGAQRLTWCNQVCYQVAFNVWKRVSPTIMFGHIFTFSAISIYNTIDCVLHDFATYGVNNYKRETNILY